VAELKENEYRVALVAARAEVLRSEAAVRAALIRPRRMLASAWRCPAADEFDAGLSGVEHRALGAISESLVELDAKIREQPELVPVDDWRRFWRSRIFAGANPTRGYS
jgi:hypothetical protein